MTQNICTKKEKVGSNQSFSEVPGAPWKKANDNESKRWINQLFYIEWISTKNKSSVCGQCVKNFYRFICALRTNYSVNLVLGADFLPFFAVLGDLVLEFKILFTSSEVKPSYR